MLLLMACPLLPAQIVPYVVMNESCSPGKDGILDVMFPEELRNECTFTWTGGSLTRPFHGQQVPGLEEGTYLLTVIANDCDKVIFQEPIQLLLDESCRPSVSIKPSAGATGCLEPPFIILTAQVAKATAPVRYYWTGAVVQNSDPYANSTVIVTDPGEYGVSIIDASGHKAEDNLIIDFAVIDCSKDPNEIAGPMGFDSLRYVNASDRMRYSISFENDPEFASAPASRVTVTYPIPPQHDMASVQLSDFGFGSFSFPVPAGANNYSTRLDLTDSLGVWLDVSAGLDVGRREIYWIFQSVDPATGFAPSSSMMGFLPVNDSLHRGEGHVTFSVAPAASLSTGDTVGAMASIVFDVNDLIETNLWTNAFDAAAPTSALAAVLASDSSSLSFTFSASDDAGGTGVAYVELMVSANGGEYLSAGRYAVGDTVLYPLVSGEIYSFVSRATDNVGNQEPFKSVPEVALDLNTAPEELLLSNILFDENAPSGTLVGTLTTFDNNGGGGFAYSLVSGAGDDDNGLFAIQGNRLITAGSFSCTGRYNYNVRIQTRDISGLTYERPFVLRARKQNFSYSRLYNQSICQGRSYSFGQRSLTQPGVYTDSMLTVRGCDSIVSVNLIVHPSYRGTQQANSCENRSFVWEGHNRTFENLLVGSYSVIDTLNTLTGCDSIVILNLAVHPTDSFDVEYVGCDSILWERYVFTEDVDTSIVLSNVNHCDSIVRLHLTVGNTAYTTIADTASQSFLWHGQTYTHSGEYYFTTQSQSGCDSIVTLLLTITQGEPLSTVADLDGLVIYPNPTTGQLNIASDNVELVEVFDYSGRCVATYKSTNQLDLSIFPTGTYALRITLSQGRTVRRVIKY